VKKIFTKSLARVKIEEIVQSPLGNLANVGVRLSE
jgi:hypothetical protein